MAGSGSHREKSCACCQRYLEHLGGKMSSFLRRMTADSKHSMIMPNRFVNHFGGKISGTIKLKSPNGIIYVVEVIKCTNKTVLQCGWEAFVDAHHIEENDFLLFRHINSCFEVLIFDSDDCEKVYSCSGIKNTSSIQEKGADLLDISSSSHDDTSQLSGSEGFTRRQMGSFSHSKTANLAVTSSSSDGSGADNSSEYESLQSNDIQTPPRREYVVSCMSYLSEAQKEKVVALIQEIEPEIMVFVAVMGKSSVQSPAPFVFISYDYAAVHFPHGTATVTLQRLGKSKKWHPRFYKRKDKRTCMLRGQWLGFVHDNNVQEEDICVFVPTKAERKFTFTVHLLRAAATHSRDGTAVQRNGSSHGRINTKKTSADNIKAESTDGEDASSESGHGVSQESLKSKNSDGPSEHPYIVPARNRLSELQKKIVEEKVRAIQSEAPIYVAFMNISNLGTGRHAPVKLELGTRYAAKHLPQKSHTVGLQCMGKLWKASVNVVVNNNRKR